MDDRCRKCELLLAALALMEAVDCCSARTALAGSRRRLGQALSSIATPEEIERIKQEFIAGKIHG